MLNTKIIDTLKIMLYNNKKKWENMTNYDEVWADHRTHRLPDAERMRYDVLCHGRGLRIWLSTSTNLRLTLGKGRSHQSYKIK